MNKINKIPEIVLYTPDRRKILCQINGVNNLSEDIRFGTVSELSFKIPQKIYDMQSYEYIDNQCYDDIVEGSVLYLNDNNDYFNFMGIKVRDDYAIDISSKTGRPSNDMTLNMNNYLSGFKVKDEVELFDIGSDSGYNWRWGCYINDSNGSILDKSDDLSAVYDGVSAYKHFACEDFIPVSTGDVVAMLSSNEFGYRIHYYRETDSKTYLGVQEGMEEHYAKYLPIGRVEIKFPYDDDSEEQLTNGYIRVELFDLKHDGSSEDSYRGYSPKYGYIKVFSGQRYCTSFNGSSKGQEDYTCGEKWWVVTSIEEINEGVIPYKNITAYSYEYTLSKKTFSLSKSTLPLYIPDKIIDVVQGNTWLRDYSTSGASVPIPYRSPQRMDRGLINQILDFIPTWNIGYVSLSVCSKYRTFDDLDNVNLYSFLINDVQSAYQCYFIFDTDRKLIHIISGTVDEDSLKGFVGGKLGCQSSLYLSWDNAIKQTNIHTTDSRCVTALRVHSADDKYGLGLINPVGNNVLYNFDSYLSYMDFIADKDKNRTLLTAVQSFLKEIENNRSTYTNYARKLIESNLEIVKLKTKVSEALTSYRSVADKINIYLADDYPNGYPSGVKYITDYPLATAELTSSDKPISDYKNYHSKNLYNELYEAANTYENVRRSYDSALKSYNQNYNKMKEISLKFSLNYKMVKDKESKGINTSILSSKEILALNDFIIEGDWTNENATFSDTYTSTDIINTLDSIYNEVISDFNSYISKHCYEFSVGTANILKINEFNIEDMYLGYSVILETKSGICQYPVCMAMHINYDDDTDFSLTFNTDYNTKPLKMKFTKLFSTINQTSVIESTWTFSE